MVKEPVFCVNCKLKSREDSNGLFYKDFCSRIHRHLDKRNLFTDQCEGKVKESEIDFEPNEYGECQYYKPKLIILLKKLIKKL